MFNDTVVSLKLLSQILLWLTTVMCPDISCRAVKRMEREFRHHLWWQMEWCVPVFQERKYKFKEHKLFG